MKIILVHGMGRTPFSMAMLGFRLRKAGLAVSFFGYSAALETFDRCLHRLGRKIEAAVGHEPYMLVGHSLGTTLIRGVLPRLQCALPAACFFLAPPSQGSHLARRLASRRLYKMLTGEMGQLLADPGFISTLPAPDVPTRIYAGTAGATGKFFAFGHEPNDGILAASETRISEKYDVVYLPSLHTFIMNSNVVARDIVAAAHGLTVNQVPAV